MKKQTKRIHPGLLLLWLCCLSLLFATGCPSENPPADGGTTPDTPGTTDKVTQPLTCTKGTLCLKVGNKDARACDILLKDAANIEKPQIAFGAEIVGQFKYRDVRLALSFISKKDEGLGTEGTPVLIKLDAGVGKVDLELVTCYDRKGVKLAKPDVSLERP